MKPLLLIPALMFSLIAWSQQPQVAYTSLIPGPEWFEGSILTNDGKELKGLVRYNDKSEILSFENGRDSRSFTPRNVTAFEFFDEVEKRQRVFYSVPFVDHKRNVTRPLFFEILLDAKEFAVISKLAPIKVDKREYSTPGLFNPITGTFSGGRYYGYPTTISYTETLFLMNRSGVIKPYLEITEKAIDGTFFDRVRTRSRILDNEIIKHYMGTYYKQIVAFADQNRLSFRKKEDLLKIFRYYLQLTHRL